MTDVLVCIKRVPDVAASVSLTEDGQGIDARHVGYTISNHENCAVELAVQIATATGGTATVLTLGPEGAADQLRSALGVGCTAAVHIVAEPGAFGPADIAREIAEVASSYDLVLLGNDAADTGDFQVGIRLAQRLGRPVVNGVSLVEIVDGVVIARGDGPEGEQTFRVPLPMVATVLEGGVEPRYPTMSGRVKAKKVEIDTREPAQEPQGSGRLRLVLPPAQPSNVEVLGKGAEAAQAVVDLFARMGVAR